MKSRAHPLDIVGNLIRNGAGDVSFQTLKSLSVAARILQLLHCTEELCVAYG